MMEPRTKTKDGTLMAFLRDVVEAPPTDECVEWPFARSGTGYGDIYFDGRNRGAHVASYCLSRGVEPPSFEQCVMHSCDNRLCVNPAHLSLGTRGQNSADMKHKGRSTRGARARSTKLTEQQVLAIKASSETQTALAAKYGVSQPLVSAIKNGRAWAWLEGTGA